MCCKCVFDPLFSALPGPAGRRGSGAGTRHLLRVSRCGGLEEAQGGPQGASWGGMDSCSAGVDRDSSTSKNASGVIRSSYFPAAASGGALRQHEPLAAATEGGSDRAFERQYIGGPSVGSNAEETELSGLPSALQGLCLHAEGEGVPFRGTQFSTALKRQRKNIS